MCVLEGVSSTLRQVVYNFALAFISCLQRASRSVWVESLRPFQVSPGCDVALGTLTVLGMGVALEPGMCQILAKRHLNNSPPAFPFKHLTAYSLPLLSLAAMLLNNCLWLFLINVLRKKQNLFAFGELWVMSNKEGLVSKSENTRWHFRGSEELQCFMSQSRENSARGKVIDKWWFIRVVTLTRGWWREGCAPGT